MDPIPSIRSFSSSFTGPAADRRPAPSRADGRTAQPPPWTLPEAAALDTDTLLEVLARVLAQEQEEAGDAARP